jgi:outer membrane receptor for ferrienterochelin and colicins
MQFGSFKYLLVFLTATAFGQLPSVQGVVRSAGQPVPFAQIVKKGTTVGTAADSLGRFQLPLTPGDHELVVSAIGYATIERRISVSAGQERNLDFELIEAVGQLEEVVISGTLREVTKMQSPIPVEVYAPSLFRKNPTSNLFEALAMVNGVQPQLNCNVCSAGDIHINGLEGPYTMVLIDGMPIVSALASVYGFFGIPNSIIKRVEVVKGPASTLYGSEAVAGVINIITQDPAQTTQVTVDAFGTSVGEFNTDVSIGGKVGRSSVLFSGNQFDYQQRRDINRDNFTDVALQRRYSLFNKWNFYRPSGRTFSLAARYIRENRWGGQMQWTEADRGSDQVYGESILTSRGELIGAYQLGTNLFWDLSYNFHVQDSYYGTMPYFGRQYVAFNQLRWAQKIGRTDWLAGIPLRHVYYDDNTPATEVEGRNQAQRTFLPGIFTQAETSWSKKFSMLAGLRYDHHSAHGSIFTPRLSLKISPSTRDVIRLTGGSGFRVVNVFTEEHAALTGARMLLIRNNLRPEQTWNLNANYARTFTHGNGFTTVDVSGFYTYFTNKIFADYDTDPNLIIYDNLNGEAISQGLTINLDRSWTSGLKLISGITLMDVYQREQVGEGERIVPQFYAPGFSGTFAASYTLPKSNWSLDLTGRVYGPMHLPIVPDDFRPPQSPWFSLINIQITKPLQDRWQVYGGIKNLLNFIPEHPILHPEDPFGDGFDASYNYAPLQGMRGFLGVRYVLK